MKLKTKQSRQSDKKKTFQVRIDLGWKKILNKLRALEDKPFKDLTEEALSNTYGVDEEGNPYRL